MAQVTFTIPDNRLTEIVDFVALALAYTGTTPNGQAETKNQFLRRQVIEHVKKWAAIGRKMEAEEAVYAGTYRDGLGIS